MRGESITVLGAGISGLSAALQLVEAGQRVTLAAHRPGREVVSAVAGAIWLPYEARPWMRVRTWAATTLAVYRRQIDEGVPGVSMVDLVYLHDGRTEEPGWIGLVPETRRRSADWFSEGLPSGYPEAFTAPVPVIEPDPYLDSMEQRFRQAGGLVEWMQTPASSLDDAPGSGLLVNCTGLGAGRLCGDEAVYPIRGQVVRVARIATRYAVAADYGPLALSYVIPRTSDTILGGTAGHRDAEYEIRPDETEQIVACCSKMVPEIADTAVLDVRVGLRPGRAEVRLEAGRTRAGRPVIHNYGHGGSGYTLCWGCAREIQALVRSLPGD